MDYGFGKTYVLPNKFTALNGTIQYYALTASKPLTAECPKEPKAGASAEDVANYAQAVKAYAESQANFLRVLETLRTYGGQPVITRIENKRVLHFTLEQSNVYGMGGLYAEVHGGQQVSKKTAEVEVEGTKVPGLIAGAKEKIAELFKGVKPVILIVDDQGHLVGEDFEAEKASTEELFVSVEVNEAF